MWRQWWVVEAGTEDEAKAVISEQLDRWMTPEQPRPSVRDVRFYTGPDDFELSGQFLVDMAQIPGVEAKTAREDLARRVAYVKLRGTGIPPRAGWVVVSRDGPHSPYPADWLWPRGPRWVVTVTWPGELPHPRV